MGDRVVYLFTPMTKPTDNLPNRIRIVRKERGKTLEQLGEAIGVSKQMMGMIERGDRPLTLVRQRAIARELQCDVADLLLASDNPYALKDDERALLDSYRALDAVGRRTVANLADNMVEWGTPPADDEDRKTA